MTDVQKTNIALERTSFIGRRSELRTLSRLVARSRLVTVFGPPGIGKTRLVLKYARERTETFSSEGGVWVVDARGLRTMADLASAVAMAVGLDVRVRANELPQFLARSLANRGAILLVFDNVDRALTRAAELISILLSKAEKAQIVVTAREPLHLDAEQRMDLGPLDGRGPTSDAVRLFIERARAVQAGYAPSRARLRAIETITERLDGLPLAIELAATRVTALTEEELVRWLPRTLDVAGTQGRTFETLRRAIAWSWDLLTPTDKRALAACSVFSGGFSLEAAAHVLSRTTANTATLERLQALRDKSLVFAKEIGGAMHFGMYESIADFARRKLRASGRKHSVERRHAEYYVAAGFRWMLEAHREGSTTAIQMLTREQRNFFSIVERGLEKDAERTAYLAALGALVALEPLTTVTGPLAPYLALLDRALDHRTGKVPKRLLANTLLARGKARVMLSRADGRGDIERARALGDRLGDRVFSGRCLIELGIADARRGELDRASKSYVAARRLFHEARARRLEGLALGQLGLLLYQQGKFDEALARYAEQGPLLSDDPLLRSAYHARIGGVHHDRGALTAARSEYKRALFLARRARSKRREATAHAALGLLYWEMGEHDRARKSHDRALETCRAHGDRAYEGICLASLGGLEALTGNLARASRHLTQAARLVAPDGNQMILGALDLYSAMLLLVRSARLKHRDPRAARELADQARASIERVIADERAMGDDARVALRILRSRFPEFRPHESPVLVVHERGEWFQLPNGGSVVSLEKKWTLGRVLVALSVHRVRAPGTPIGTYDLVEAAWPDQSVPPLAGANRVYVALAALRKLGLKTILKHTGDGYLLDPNVHVSLTG